jgi:hypothetical protein
MGFVSDVTQMQDYCHVLNCGTLHHSCWVCDVNFFMVRFVTQEYKKVNMSCGFVIGPQKIGCYFL